MDPTEISPSRSNKGDWWTWNQLQPLQCRLPIPHSVAAPEFNPTSPNPWQMLILIRLTQAERVAARAHWRPLGRFLTLCFSTQLLSYHHQISEKPASPPPGSFQSKSSRTHGHILATRQTVNADTRKQNGRLLFPVVKEWQKSGVFFKKMFSLNRFILGVQYTQTHII